MSKPIKQFFSHDICEAKASTPEALGTVRILEDGRRFRLAKAGASALSPGKLAMAPAGVANHMNLTGAACPVGTTRITAPVGATAVTEKQYERGFLQIVDGTGAGMQYMIQSHNTCPASGEVQVVLAEPIRVALDATSKLSLAPNPWLGAIETATEENVPLGVTPIPVPAGYYYWAQTAGPALALVSGTPAVGTLLAPGPVAGSLAGASTTIATTVTQPIIGKKVTAAGVDTKYGAVMLLID